jgi:hypothetical protein
MSVMEIVIEYVILKTQELYRQGTEKKGSTETRCTQSQTPIT